MPVACCLFLFETACSESTASPPPPPGISLGDSGYVDESTPDAAKPIVDGGYEGIRSDRFITKVVSFTPGACAGFGAEQMPGVITGPPVGAGNLKGSLDVVTLGVGGELVVSFDPNAIIDGPGPDFIVFENAFHPGGNPNNIDADPGEVSVSEDGVTWKSFECTPPNGTCAGWHPVYSAPGNGISPIDTAKAGGEAYDLSELGLAKARFVRIRDKSSESCEGQPNFDKAGFDLDAIAVIHAETP